MDTGEKLQTAVRATLSLIVEYQFISILFKDLQEENESLKAHVQEVALPALSEVQ